MKRPTIQFQTDSRDIRLVHGMNVYHTFPCHIHHSFSLGIIYEGQRDIHIDGKSHIISAHECFLINPYQPHSCDTIDGSGHNYRVVSIPPKLFQDIFREITGRDEVPYFPQTKIAEPSIFNELAVWLEQQPRNGTNGESDLSDVLRELTLRYARAKPIVQPRQTRLALVRLTCEYIESHLNHIARLDKMADMVHISPFYLNRIFREEIGIPPYAYLIQTRIKKSPEVLLQTGSIIETAYSLGFADQSHFSRFFKKYIGITPKQYLDLHRARTH
ncbi:MAG: AraC family transcriptional regulator [Anaerolineae bacterium]|nr:AraC family transcriptional regulator [Anaerolineae bacterium]